MSEKFEKSLLRQAKIDVLLAMNNKPNYEFFCQINAYRAKIILKKIGQTAINNQLLVDTFKDEKFINVLSSDEFFNLIEKDKELISRNIQKRFDYLYDKNLDSNRQKIHELRMQILGTEEATAYLNLRNDEKLRLQQSEIEIQKEKERLQQEFDEMKKLEEYRKQHEDEILALRDRQAKRQIELLHSTGEFQQVQQVDVNNDIVDDEILNIFNNV